MSCHKFIPGVRKTNPLFWSDNGKGRSQRHAEKMDKVYSPSKVTQEKHIFLGPPNFPIITLNCARYANNLVSMFLERKDQA